MKCKYGYTFDVISINKDKKARDVFALQRQDLHLVDHKGDCLTCQMRMIRPPSAPVAKWFDDHLPSVQHVETVGAGALVWCTNCGPWIDDDAWVDAETLLDRPINELMKAALAAERPLSVVARCSLCED